MRRRIVAAIVAPLSRPLVQMICETSCEQVAVAGRPLPPGLPVIALPSCGAAAWALRSGADGLLLVYGGVERDLLDAILEEFRRGHAPVVSCVGAEVWGVEAFGRISTSSEPRAVSAP